MKLTRNRRLPPINNIESFIKVVELGSISAAAAEVSLTQSAISRHVIDLEKFVGRKLLIRTATGITITDEAKDLATKLAFLLGDLNSVLYGAEEGIFSETIRISAPPIFCINFFARNANRIQEIFRGDVEILSRIGAPDLYLENIDIAVITTRTQPNDYPGAPLFTPAYYPYISCDLVAASQRLEPADFGRYNLLNQLAIQDAWTIYFRDLGLDIYPRPRVTFSLIDSALAAILNGQGTGFLPEFVAREYVKTGAIRKFHGRPFHSVKVSYFLIYKKEIMNDARFHAFRDWLDTVDFTEHGGGQSPGASA